MRRRTLLAVALLSTVCILGVAQTPPPVPTQAPTVAPASGPNIAPGVQLTPVEGIPPTAAMPPVQFVPVVASPVPPPKPTSIDSLLDALENVKKQQATLAQRETELKKAIQEMAVKQTERMNKLGVGAPEPAKNALPGVDVFGRVVLQGVPAAHHEKIARLVPFKAGQPLNYPDLDKLREALTKAGYEDPVVEVVPGAGGALDVRIRLADSK